MSWTFEARGTAAGIRGAAHAYFVSVNGTVAKLPKDQRKVAMKLHEALEIILAEYGSWAAFRVFISEEPYFHPDDDEEARPLGFNVTFEVEPIWDFLQ